MKSRIEGMEGQISTLFDTVYSNARTKIMEAN